MIQKSGETFSNVLLFIPSSSTVCSYFLAHRAIDIGPPNAGKVTSARMSGLVVTLVLVSLVANATCRTLSSTFFDSTFIEKAKGAVEKDCGHPCLSKFEEMLGWLEVNSDAVLSGKMAGPLNTTKFGEATPPMLAWAALANRELEKVWLLQNFHYSHYYLWHSFRA
jgi:hypothetical protein